MQTLQTLGWFFEMSKVQKCKCQNCEGFGENTWRRSVINWTARSCELQIQLKVFVMWVVANLANYIQCTFSNKWQRVQRSHDLHFTRPLLPKLFENWQETNTVFLKKQLYFCVNQMINQFWCQILKYAKYWSQILVLSDDKPIFGGFDIMLLFLVLKLNTGISCMWIVI